MKERINAGEDPCQVAKEEMPKFVHAAGKVNQGLTNRRADEVNLMCGTKKDEKWEAPQKEDN